MPLAMFGVIMMGKTPEPRVALPCFGLGKLKEVLTLIRISSPTASLVSVRPTTSKLLFSCFKYQFLSLVLFSEVSP